MRPTADKSDNVWEQKAKQPETAAVSQPPDSGDRSLPRPQEEAAQTDTPIVSISNSNKEKQQDTAPTSTSITEDAAAVSQRQSLEKEDGPSTSKIDLGDSSVFKGSVADIARKISQRNKMLFTVNGGNKETNELIIGKEQR